MTDKNYAKLSPCGLGFALGIVMAFSCLVMGWLAWLFGWGVDFVNMVGSVYIGYQANWWGPIVGAVWGFVDWFVGGLIIAWLYNMCLCCCKNKCNNSNTASSL